MIETTTQSDAGWRRFGVMEKTELAMKQRTQKADKETQRKRLSDEPAEMNSVDSPICGWGTHMPTRFGETHEVQAR
jgi:hypothetical protein